MVVFDSLSGWELHNFRLCYTLLYGSDANTTASQLEVLNNTVGAASYSTAIAENIGLYCAVPSSGMIPALANRNYE